MKSLISLWSITAEELAVRCCTSATRDINTVASRTEHEGLSFLAITLADLGKATKKWLDRGFVDPLEAPAFKTAGGGSRLPAFLQGFYGRVFDPFSGTLLEWPDVEAIYALNQLLLMFGKIALPEEDLIKGQPQSPDNRKVVSAARERRAMSEFLQCEQDVRDADARLDESFFDDFRQMSAVLFGDLFAKVDRDIYWGRIIPKHGPGATADRLSANAKWNQQTWTSRLQGIFPGEELLSSSVANFRQREVRFDILEPGTEVPVRVIAVPKTLKTPRIIAIEPTCMQYVQQGLYRAILEGIGEDSLLTNLIGLDDQTPNQRMAYQGSQSGDLATLDLSEASDRVSNLLVRTMLEDYSFLQGAVDSSRSRRAYVPGHGVIRLAKFASMGSALCFPMEAMVFTTIIFLGIKRELRAPLSAGTIINRFWQQVRVYGDDIICPREHVHSVVGELESFGFKVNTGKSFWTGRFRESCGKEYYDGTDVSIVRVRSVLPTRRQHANEVIKAVALRNHLYKAGLWQSARWMDDYLGKLLKAYPNVASTSSLLGRESYLGYEFAKLDPNTQGPMTKGYIKRAEIPSDPLDGTGALLKCLVPTERITRWGLTPLPPVRRLPVDGSTVADEHLERSGRPKRVSIKLGWSSPF
jgi:hypothetical protein